MALWNVKAGNILDEPADTLICPANVCLNLSGGVGSELLQRYGQKLQDQLHSLIATRIPRCASQGEFFETIFPGLPYRAILHAVAVDPMYQSSSAIITKLVFSCLKRADFLKAHTIALAALGTGYGNLTLEDFSRGIHPLIGRNFENIKHVTICINENDRAFELDSFLKS